MKIFDKFLLFSYISYISIFILIFILGISGVFASEIIVSPTAKFYDNSGSSVSSVETEFENNRYFATFTTATDSYGALVTFQLNTTLQKGRIYTIFILAGAESNGGQTRASSKKYIGIGSNFNNANNSYINSNNETSYSASSGTTTETSRGVYYTFIANETGSYISVPYTTQYTCSNCRQYFNGYTLEDLGSSENLSQDEVNDIINSQTTIIQNNINDMEQSIVDSNKETQDVIKDQFNDCRPSENLINYKNFTNINSNTSINIITNGLIVIKVNNSSGYGVASETLSLKPNTTYTIFTNSNWEISKPSNWGWRLYNVNDESLTSFSRNDKFTFTTNNNTEYILYYYIGSPNTEIGQVTLSNIMLNEGSTSKTYEPYGEEICTNKIDETNNQLGNLNDSLNNSNSSGATNDASNFFSNFTTDTFGLTSIITAPLSLINSITSSSCSTLRLPLPYLDNKYLELPCMNTIYTRYFGSFFNIYQTITFGIVAYWVIVRIFNQVKDFKNPDHDEIEVLDL